MNLLHNIKLYVCGFTAAAMKRSVDRSLIGTAIDGDAGAVEHLIKLGANPNVSIRGWTPLHYAAHKGHDEVVESLLRFGANPLLGTKQFNSTPLDVARLMGHTSIMFKLRAAETRDRTTGG